MRLHDVATKTCVGVLSGHTCTIKTVTWDPHNPRELFLVILDMRSLGLALTSTTSRLLDMISTASRDGSIRVWDRRVRGFASTQPEGLAVGTVNHIKHAHGNGKKSKGVSCPLQTFDCDPY